MPRKNNTKAVCGVNRRNWLALMSTLGATPVSGHYAPERNAHRLEVKGCILECMFNDGAEHDSPVVFSRWEDVNKARSIGLPMHNAYSGKWNHHYPHGAECLEAFATGLRHHLDEVTSALFQKNVGKGV